MMRDTHFVAYVLSFMTSSIFVIISELLEYLWTVPSHRNAWKMVSNKHCIDFEKERNNQDVLSSLGKP